jgi:iron complex outermembrane receptor protein
MNRADRVAGLLAGASVFALATAYSANAQSAAPTEDVVVTGSRIITNGNNMPTPVTVISTQEITDNVPKSVMDGLQQLPIFAGGRSPTTNVGNSSQNLASHQFNIRNVGITRTLVLYNGRRIAPTSPTGEVNADIIPNMLLQRVDVVTGGVSAVYGSDAVAGVVNFISDHSLEGIKGEASFGTSDYGDGMTTRVGVAGGMTILGGYGHIQGSIEYYNNDGILGADKLQRPWAGLVKSSQGAGTASNPNKLVLNTRLASTSYGGFITTSGNSASNPYRDMTFNADGSLRPFVHGAATGSGNVESGGDGIYYKEASLVATTKQLQGNGRFDYNFTDDIAAYIDVTYTKTQNRNNHQTNEFRNLVMNSANPFLTAAQNLALAPATTTSGGLGTFTMSKAMEQAPPLSSNTWTTAYLINTGLKGEVGGYNWEFSYTHNENNQLTRNDANINNRKLYAALDAVRDGSGNIVCRVTVTNPGLLPGCVPLNPFGPGSETPAMLNYILEQTKFTAVTVMDNIGGSITGSPFDNWAGPVGIALSGEWRKTNLDVVSNAQPSTRVDCTGLRYNCTVNTLSHISNILNNASGLSQSVGEGALELQFPLFRGLPLAEVVDLNGALRYTNYNNSGTVMTWKAGLHWTLSDEWTLRAVKSRDIRAPNLNELYAPSLVNPAGTTDRHVLTGGLPTQLQAPFITISNSGLRPEVANTTTIGAVYRPFWLPEFSLSVDYYHINIGNAITNISGQNTTVQDICEASNGTSQYCSLIIRPLPFADRSIANLVTAFITQPRNAQSVITDGVDIETNYSTPLFGGNLNLRMLASYQPMLKTVQFPGANTLNAAGASPLASFRGTLFARYSWNEWTLAISERFRNGTKLSSDRYCPAAVVGTCAVVSPIFASSFRNPGWALYTNLNLTYNWENAPLGTTTQFYVAVENVFDRQPTSVGGGGTVPSLFPGTFGTDDTIGRFYTVGMRVRL